VQAQPLAVEAPHLRQVEGVDVGLDDADVEPALGLEVDPREEPAGDGRGRDSGQRTAGGVAQNQVEQGRRHGPERQLLAETRSDQPGQAERQSP